MRESNHLISLCDIGTDPLRECRIKLGSIIRRQKLGDPFFCLIFARAFGVSLCRFTQQIPEILLPQFKFLLALNYIAVPADHVLEVELFRRIECESSHRDSCRPCMVSTHAMHRL